MPKRATKVGSITRRISRNLQGLRRDLVALSRAIQSVARSDRGAGSRGGDRSGGRRRARRRLSEADRARLQVQGEYLGLVRHLSARNRARVKALRSRRGYPPAIKMARRLVKGNS